MPSTWQGLLAGLDDPEGRQLQQYSFYGLSVRSEIPLTFPEQEMSGSPDVTFFIAPRENFDRITAPLKRNPDPEQWYEYVECPDRSEYLHWENLFEFLVSPDGRSVACGFLEQASIESFETYLLGQVLAFALIKQGYEPLHATVVVVDGLGLALLGRSGMGKSTMAAAFLKGGHLLMTDDMLLLRDVGGRVCGFGGPPRIKLRPEALRLLLPDRNGGARMNPLSEKFIIPLKIGEWHPGPVPLAGCFVLDEAESDLSPVRIERLPQSAALLELVKARFNSRVRHPERLKRQFYMARDWSTQVPVSRISYPRAFSTIEDVRDAMIASVVTQAAANA